MISPSVVNTADTEQILPLLVVFALELGGKPLMIGQGRRPGQRDFHL